MSTIMNTEPFKSYVKAQQRNGFVVGVVCFYTAFAGSLLRGQGARNERLLECRTTRTDSMHVFRMLCNVHLGIYMTPLLELTVLAIA